MLNQWRIRSSGAVRRAFQIAIFLWPVAASCAAKGQMASPITTHTALTNVLGQQRVTIHREIDNAAISAAEVDELRFRRRAASLSPASLSFANQSPGTTSPPQSALLTNISDGVLDISNITITGTNYSDFSQTNTCGTTLSPRSNCTIAVSFTPSGSGTRTALLSVTDNANGSPQTVTLTGTDDAPAVNISPASLSFGSQPLGTTSAAQPITLSNSGNAPLTITSIAVAGTDPSDFAQTNTCGASLAAGASCAISVTFTPAAAGAFMAALTLTDNGAGSPQSVSLSGTGAGAASVTFSPSSVTFGSCPVDTGCSPETTTLNNGGSTALNITGIAFGGPDATDFSENNTCIGTPVAGSGSCTITIQFAPGGVGSRSASLTVSDNGTGSPQSVGVTGTGAHDVILTWTASSTPGIAGYNIYRGTTSGGETSTPLNTTPVSNVTYCDPNVMPGATYYYVITAVAANDQTQSANSNEASAIVPSP